MMYGAAEDIWSDGYESGQEQFAIELLQALGLKLTGRTPDLEAVLDLVDLNENAEQLYQDYLAIQKEKEERRKAFYASLK